MTAKKLPTVKLPPVRGKLKDRDIIRAILTVRASREAREVRPPVRRTRCE